MSRFTAPPGCESIKMKSTGEVFYANRSGSINVPDHYDAEVKRSAQNKRGYLNEGVSIQMHKGEGTYCPNCNFHAFAFSQKCPKCGTSLRDYVKPVVTEDYIVTPTFSITVKE